MSERALMNVMGRVSKVFPHRLTRKKKRSGIAIPMLKTTQRKTEPLVPAIREALSSVRIVYGEMKLLRAYPATVTRLHTAAPSLGQGPTAH